MKKILIALLSMILLVSLVACGSTGTGGNANGSESGNNASTVPESNGNGSSQTNTDASSNESSESTGEDSSDSSEPTGGKTLVVYYSATNNTEAIAGYIAEATGGDLFEITPTESYTSDDLNWTNPDSRVSKEHDDESLRNVELTTTTVENWDEYDTVFIGYPIWWGIAAWPTDTFVKANDFTGKTVIPFCTSSSSGLGQSGELLKAEANGGNWLEGQRFQSRASEDVVKEWVNGLGL